VVLTVIADMGSFCRFLNGSLFLLLATLHSPERLAADDWVYPLDVAAKATGELYIADRKLPGVLQYAEGRLSVLVRAESKFRTPLNAVRCVHVTASGQLLAGDSATREVYLIQPDGQLQPLTDGKIGIPTQISSTGDLVYVTDLELARVWKFPLAGGTPEAVAEVPGPRGVDIDAAGNIWILSAQKPQLRRISPTGEQQIIHEGLTFEFPQQVLISPAGVAFVSDGYARCIWKVDSTGKAEKWAVDPAFQNPVGICWQNDNLLLIDSRVPALFEISPEGKVSQRDLSANK
jgi:sugar lactone lactonase YvrE